MCICFFEKVAKLEASFIISFFFTIKLNVKMPLTDWHSFVETLTRHSVKTKHFHYYLFLKWGGELHCKYCSELLSTPYFVLFLQVLVSSGEDPFFIDVFWSDGVTMQLNLVIYIFGLYFWPFFFMVSKKWWWNGISLL